MSCANASNILISGTCSANCPSGTIRSGSSCVNCPANCLNCTLTGGSASCSLCMTSYLLASANGSNICVQSCSSLSIGTLNYVQINGQCQLCNISGCVLCNFANNRLQCSLCTSTTYLYNQQCITICPNGTMPSSNTCTPCSINCQQCSASGCTVCQNGSSLLNGNCVSTCGLGYYSANSTCHICSAPNCVNCTSTTCLFCQPPYVIDSSGGCTSCLSGYFLGSGACQACSS